MRKILAGIATMVMLVTGMTIQGSAEAEGAPSISAASAIVLECDTGRVLYGKNETAQMSMASTTKIMTALLAVECGNLDQTVTVTPEMVQVEGSSMGLQAGYQVTLEGLVYGMLLPSGNDAANATAIVVGGSVDRFVEMMNERARELGAVNTHFSTPSGLDADDHYSTAYDMALIGAAAMKNERFAAVAGQSSAVVQMGNPPEARRLYNHNRLLNDFEGTIGVKTGYTKKSGRCLVTCVERDGMRLLVVTLKAPSDWQDHKSLYEWAFAQIKRTALPPAGEIDLPVTGGVGASVQVATEFDAYASLLDGEISRVERLVELPRFVYAPVKQGDPVGRVTYTLDGITIFTSDLIASSDIEAYIPPNLWERIWSFIKGIFGVS